MAHLSLPILLADAAPALPQQNFMQTLVMIGMAIIFFYFILWRPEQKRRKAMEQQRSALKKGDRVTAMGIVGTVVKLQEKTVVLKMVDGVSRIEVLTAAITDVQPSSDTAADSTTSEEGKRVDFTPEGK